MERRPALGPAVAGQRHPAHTARDAGGSLRGVDDFDAAVLGPAVFGRVGAGRALFAVAADHDLGARATVGLHGRRHGVAAALAQALVVFAAAALVGVAFQGHARGRTVTQVLGVAGDDGLELRLQRILVEVEVDHA